MSPFVVERRGSASSSESCYRTVPLDWPWGRSSTDSSLSVEIVRPIGASVRQSSSDACTSSNHLEQDIGIGHRISDQANPTEDSSYLDRIEQWIQACNSDHAEICVPSPISERPPADVPRWLIDTYQQCIVPGLSANRYLALSYVWPESRESHDLATGPPRTLLLDHATLSDLQCPGYLNNEEIATRIPMVIKHAIEFTGLLGETYLWVDRLCIVQDDTGDGGTLSQVAKMDKIYAGAYLTIIAAAPEEMYSTASAAEWPSSEYRRIKAETQKSLRIAFGLSRRTVVKQRPRVRELNEEEVVGIMSARYHELSCSRWATRGWTYQEQILCGRAIMFLESGVLWDCHCCMWDGVDLHPDTKLEGALPLRADMGRRFLTRWWPDFGLYIDVICLYNGRSFSYPQDALLGITGILNSLDRSFPGGFVQGLPRLFLDHALIWQPFGTAQRRMDRNEDGTRSSSLPSWSWCGWQGFIDPLSLRSGLSYVYQQEYVSRARSWRTRNLVQWHLLTNEHRLEAINEPCLLDDYAEFTKQSVERSPPDGWSHADASNSSYRTIRGTRKPSFVHQTDSTFHFKHPVPLKGERPQQSTQNGTKHLVCSTTTTILLLPAVLLKMWSHATEVTVGLSKISVFEDQTFKRGPNPDQTCPILVLQQPNGTSAGLLRLMNKDEAIDEDTTCELIAISTGSVNPEDLANSFEWRLFETGRDSYIVDGSGNKFEYGPTVLRSGGGQVLVASVMSAFDKDAATKEPPWDLFESITTELSGLKREGDETEAMTWNRWYDARRKHERHYRWADTNAWFDLGDDHCHKKQVQIKATRNSSEIEEEESEELPGTLEELFGDDYDTLCEFYNVLWIERKDGIAYRRACGWVPKYIWEAHATGPVQVTLG